MFRLTIKIKLKMGSACSSTKEKSGAKNKTSLENKVVKVEEEIPEEESVLQPYVMPLP